MAQSRRVTRRIASVRTAKVVSRTIDRRTLERIAAESPNLRERKAAMKLLSFLPVRRSKKRQ